MPADERALVPFGAAMPRCLVVDDEPEAVERCARVLREAGIDALAARDGKHALEILEREPVHLIILDRHTPELDGLEVIERLRAQQSTVHLPIILVTSETDLGDRVYGLEHGADDYLTKPVDPEELVARARAQLRRRSPDDSIRGFVESANDAFVSWDATGAITEWTSRAEALFGWSRAEVLGESFGALILTPRHRIVHALRMERFLHDDDRALLGKWFELTAQHRDGRELPIEMTVWVVANRDHHTFNAFVRDLSGREEIEAALRDRERLQTLVDNVSDVIVLTDRVGVIVYTSPSARTVLGYEPDELYGHVMDEFVHDDDRSAFGRALARAFESGSERVKAQRTLARDGRYIWMEATATIIRDRRSGEVTGVEIVSRDITGRKLTDDARSRATRDLTHMINDLRATVDREHRTADQLRELDHIKTDLVSTVSHELRIPLTSITAYIELLGDPDVGPLTQRQREMLDVVARNSNRLLQMIDNLLTIGGVESGLIAIEPRPLEVAPAIEAASRAMQASADEKSIRIELDVAPDTGPVLGDGPQLDRVLLNLLSNAIKFTPEGGKVIVRARRAGGEVEVVVADNGMGIPLDEQPQLFAPFFRATDATDRAIAGTGLGLVIVKNIVERHGGSIEIRSAPGAGTTVRFTLRTALVAQPTTGPS